MGVRMESEAAAVLGTFRPKDLRPLLAPLEPPDLQTLAARYEVGVAGCETKWDYVNRIAASTAAARIMENMSKARDTPPAGTTLQAETPAPSPAPAPVEAGPIEAPPVGAPAPAPPARHRHDSLLPH